MSLTIYEPKYYAHELQRSYANEHTDKTDCDYIQIDSDGADAPKRQFAEKLDSREDVKFFMKLPVKFKIETPVGPYNPDGAIIRQDESGEDHMFMVRETKSTLDEYGLRPTENAKIKAATEHFKQLGIGTETVPGYAVSTPDNWSL